MPDDRVPSGRLKRLGRLAYLTARTTGDLLSAQARRRLGGAAAGGDELQQAGERILSTLGQLKGAALKLGQALAMDPDALPEEARRVVAKLLSQAPERMPWDTVAGIVRAELGGEPDALFASFEREPLAAASLGQVHGARLADGREVVVKVQYPGVDEALESDLSNAAVLVRGLSLTGQTLDARAYYDELRASLLRELDYREEARQAVEYAAAARAYPELEVPRPVPERSSHRVLTLTRLRGVPLLDFIEANEPDARRFEVARLLAFAIWGPFYAERLVHADPHPGNFLVLPDGRLGVLDFGATKRLSERFADVYRHFLEENAAGRRVADVGPWLEKAGFTFLGDDKEEAFEFCDRLSAVVQRPVGLGDFDFGTDSLVSEARRVFRADPQVALRVKPPPEALLFYRSAAGLAQNFRLLRARGPFQTVIQEIQRRGRA